MKHIHKTLALFALFAISLFFTPLLFQELASAQMDHNYFELERIENTDGAFCFAVAGDPHFGKHDYSDDVFEWVVEDVNSKDFAFLVVNGDIADWATDSQYSDYYRSINHSDTPVITVIGNHDVRLGGRSRFENMFGELTYFDFAVGDYQFIILDSADHELGTEQLNWLETQLQEHYKDIIITHIPRAHLDDADHLTALIEEYTPELIIYSHNHNYYNVFIDEIEVIITDAAGGSEPPESYISLCIDAVEQSQCAHKREAFETCGGENITHKQVFAPRTLF